MFQQVKFAQQPIWQTIVFTLVYFAWFYGVVGLRIEHIWAYMLLVVLYFANQHTRRFLYGFAIFFLFVLKYDSLRAYPNYLFNPIHIADLYRAEKACFGIMQNGVLLTPNEWALQYTHPIADFMSGLFYGSWIPVPLLFGFYLYLYHKQLFLHFIYGFVLTCMIGLVGYYLYPAAPPWYVALHGFEPNIKVMGNAAGLLRFDALVGFPVFEQMYNKAPAPFAAMPSLHAAYPVVCLLYGWRLQRWQVNLGFAVFALGMWITAIYTMHHYLIDVLAGIATAATSYLLLQQITQTKWGNLFFTRLLEKIGG